MPERCACQGQSLTVGREFCQACGTTLPHGDRGFVVLCVVGALLFVGGLSMLLLL